MYRTWLYHADLPKGKIFDDEVEIKEALANGWVESPAAIPGKPIEKKAAPVRGPAADPEGRWTVVEDKPKKRGRKPKVTDDGAGS